MGDLEKWEAQCGGKIRVAESLKQQNSKEPRVVEDPGQRETLSTGRPKREETESSGKFRAVRDLDKWEAQSDGKLRAARSLEQQKLYTTEGPRALGNPEQGEA